jgi:RNA 2',3'-cyclic 3'-phosphodiesterase
MKKVRSFIAVNLPDKIKEKIGLVQFTLKKNVSGTIQWVKCENIHITLKFLDTIPEEQVGLIGEALKKNFSAFKSFPAILDGYGVFPDEQRPRVIWLGLKQGGESLSALAAMVEKTVTALGLPRADKPFAPHVTLGRVKFLPGPLQLCTQLKTLTSFGTEIKIKSIDVMESILKPDGAQYRVLQTVLLP